MSEIIKPDKEMIELAKEIIDSNNRIIKINGILTEGLVNPPMFVKSDYVVSDEDLLKLKNKTL